jgi:NDP-sugar pyrophosphorylase family protein
MDTAVVLAGGAGLRLRPYTNDKPKAMVQVYKKPLLEWIVEWLTSNGVRNIVFGVAYKRGAITKHFGDGTGFGARIKYSVHTVEGGTAEGFRLAIKRHINQKTFIAMNGDELVDLSLQKLESYHNRHGCLATIAVSPLRSPYGIVDLNQKTKSVVSFREKAVIPKTYVSVGVYIFNRDILRYIPTQGDVEKTTFPRLAANKEIKAYIHKGFWRTINTHKDLQDVAEELEKKGFFFQRNPF